MRYKSWCQLQFKNVGDVLVSPDIFYVDCCNDLLMLLQSLIPNGIGMEGELYTEVSAV